MARERIDLLMVSRGLAPSRARARALIEAAKVTVGGAPVLKPGALVSPAALVEVHGVDHPYVSRGGLKLEGALADLALDPAGLVVADVGASTGGFTDCMLRAGAARVYAIDVGHDQLHASLRADARVVSLEGVNARHLDANTLPERVDLVVVDASFISVTKLLPALVRIVKPGARVLTLVKPQFEVGPENVGKKGVVASDALRARALDGVVVSAAEVGLRWVRHADARVPGPEGNREIFVLLQVPG